MFREFKKEQTFKIVLNQKSELSKYKVRFYPKINYVIKENLGGFNLLIFA